MSALATALPAMDIGAHGYRCPGRPAPPHRCEEMLPGCPKPRPPSYTGRGCLSAPYRLTMCACNEPEGNAAAGGTVKNGNGKPSLYMRRGLHGETMIGDCVDCASTRVEKSHPFSWQSAVQLFCSWLPLPWLCCKLLFRTQNL